MEKPAKFLMDDFGLFFHADEILIRKSDNQFIIQLCEINCIQWMDEVIDNRYFLGEIVGKKVCAIDISPEVIDGQDEFYFLPIRKLLETLTGELFQLVCKAKQLLNWHKISLFCSVCGHLNQFSETEIAKVCSYCRRISYPSYSPAVIVLVERNDEILLARSPHFTQGVYSPLAGFISPAETAEEAVVREVKEEVGLEISHVQYFASQIWPFPNSFMIGYTAQFVSGDICIDSTELEDARWFNICELPLLPSRASISRHLIDAFIARNIGDREK